MWTGRKNMKNEGDEINCNKKLRWIESEKMWKGLR